MRTTNGNLSEHDTYTLSEFAITTTPPGEFSLATIGLGDVEHTLAEVKTRNAYGTAGLTAACAGCLSRRCLAVPERKGHPEKSEEEQRRSLT